MKLGEKKILQSDSVCLLESRVVGVVVLIPINLDTVASTELLTGGLVRSPYQHRIPFALKEPSGGSAKNMKYWGDGVC